jgi:hypothetical protein
MTAAGRSRCVEINAVDSVHVGWVKFAEPVVGHHNPTDLEFESRVNHKSTRDDDPPGDYWFVGPTLPLTHTNTGGDLPKDDYLRRRCGTRRKSVAAHE